MKKILALAVMTASVSVMGFQARMDLNGAIDSINLKPESKSKGCVLSNPGWVKDETKRGKRLYFSSPILKGNWEEVEFSFTPDKDGVIDVSIRGQWYDSKKNQKPRYVYFKEIEIINGSTLKNGNFKIKDKIGHPTGWWFDKNGKELPVFKEENGETIVRLQHFNQMSQRIPVKMGQVVKIKATVKNGMGE